jgi:hypothetical protein
LSQIKSYCPLSFEELRPEAYPVAYNLDSGNWLVAVDTPIMFYLNCPGQSSNTISVSPPIGNITLQNGCSASSERLRLSAYYYNSSKEVIGLMDFNTNLQVNDFLIWNEVEKVANVSELNLGEPLSISDNVQVFNDVPSINHLAARLNSLSYPRISQRHVNIAFIVTCTIIFIIIIMYLVLRVLNHGNGPNCCGRMWRLVCLRKRTPAPQPSEKAEVTEKLTSANNHGETQTRESLYPDLGDVETQVLSPKKKKTTLTLSH